MFGRKAKRIKQLEADLSMTQTFLDQERQRSKNAWDFVTRLRKAAGVDEGADLYSEVAFLKTEHDRVKSAVAAQSQQRGAVVKVKKPAKKTTRKKT